MGGEKSSQSWWATLPGVITAVTGLLGAVGTLFLALNKAGVISNASVVSPPAFTSSQPQTVPPTPKQKAPANPNHPGSAQHIEEVAQRNVTVSHPEATRPQPQRADWTDSVPFRDLILDYNSHTGSAEVRRAGGSGEVLRTYAPGAFSAGWTNLAYTPNGILFYNRENGSAALGRIDEAGNHTTVKSYPAGAFAVGWTHIVWTPNGILFYNSATGAGSVVRLDPNGNGTTIKAYRPGSPDSFAKGWTRIVYTRQGIEYYNDATGASAIGEIDPNGNHRTIR